MIGCCTDNNPVSALAQAAAARRFIEANLIYMGAEKCLSRAREAYQIEELDIVTWRADEPLQRDAQLLCIAEAHFDAGAKRYVSLNPGATPDELLEGIEVLLAPSGIFIAIGASGSGNRGKGT